MSRPPVAVRRASPRAAAWALRVLWRFGRPHTLIGTSLSIVGLYVIAASLDRASSRGLRDRAIILCIARLGLRAGEVAQLQLDDIDWCDAVVRVRARKTGHGALLPLPTDVGAAVADYLQQARPNTATRQVFVLHRQRVGAPISSDIVGRAVDTALARAGMDAPTRGANLLRHSLSARSAAARSSTCTPTRNRSLRLATCCPRI